MVEVNLELVFAKFRASHVKRARDRVIFIENQFKEQVNFIEHSHCEDAKIWLIFWCQQQRIQFINQVLKELAQKGPYETSTFRAVILNFYEKNLGEFWKLVSHILMQMNQFSDELLFDYKHAHLDNLYKTWQREDNTLPALSKLNQLNNYYAYVQYYLDNPSILENALKEDERYLEKLKDVIHSLRGDEVELKLIVCLSSYLQKNISIAKQGVSLYEPSTWLYEVGIAALKRKIVIDTIYELFNIYQWIEKTRHVFGNTLDEHARIALNYCTLPRRFSLIKKILANALEEESKANISPPGITGIFHYRRPKLLRQIISIDCEAILSKAKQETEQQADCFAHFFTGLPACYFEEESSMLLITPYYNHLVTSPPTYEEAVPNAPDQNGDTKVKLWGA